MSYSLRSRVVGSWKNRLATVCGGMCVASALGASSLLHGQTVTFSGAQTTLPFEHIFEGRGIAVNGSGDVMLSAFGYEERSPVVVLPRMGTTYGLQTTLPALNPQGLAVDSAGNLFLVDGQYDSSPARVLRFPLTPTGYGSPETLVDRGLGSQPVGIAVDGAGNIFVTDFPGAKVLELPRTESGYGSLTTLATDGLHDPLSVAVDSSGNLYIADTRNNRIVKLPKTDTGFGTQITVPTTGLSNPSGVAIDSAGDMFIADTSNSRVVELPWIGTGYGPQTVLPLAGPGGQPTAIAFDHAGNVFVSGNVDGIAIEWQIHSVEFGTVNFCESGQTAPAPCSETVTLNYKVPAGGTLGTPKVLTGGEPNLDFTLAGSTCTGSVAAGATCTVGVQFAPTTGGVRNGSVEITDGSGNVLTTTQINGVVSPARISPGGLNFGIIQFPGSDTLPLTITNIGQAPFTFTPVINGPQYVVSENPCTSGVAAGGSCTLQVEFNPIDPATHDEMLKIETNAGVAPSIPLQGSAHGVGVSTVTQNPLQFGTIAAGTTKTLYLSIKDYAKKGNQLLTFSVSGSAYSVVPGGQCSTKGLHSTNECAVQIQFAPITTGEQDGTLTIIPSVSPSSTVKLTGNAD